MLPTPRNDANLGLLSELDKPAEGTILEHASRFN